MSKIIIFFLIVTLVQCTPKKLTLDLQELAPDKIHRSSYKLNAYNLSRTNEEFVQKSEFIFAVALKRSFNKIQTLNNLYKTGQIDSEKYIYELQEIKESYQKKNKLNSLYLTFPETIDDTTYNAEVKILVAKRHEDEFVFIIDENNNGIFSDDNQIKFTASNYDSVFKNRRFNIKNLYKKSNGVITNFEMTIIINQLSSNSLFTKINNEAEIDVWIDNSNYYKVTKKRTFKNNDLFVSISNYDINYLDFRTRVNGGSIEKKTKVKYYYYEGSSFWHKRKYYIIDSLSKQKSKLYLTKKIVQHKDTAAFSYESINKVTISNDLLNYNNYKIDLFDVIKQSKDSIIIIDFWASWCKPCREEIPLLKEVQKNLANYKVKFISISLDTDINDWKKASLADSLINENSYVLINSWESDFAKRNALITIPRYMIINKSGIIVNDSAPRPSDSRFTELIFSYLK